MKKKLALVFAAAFVALSLSACGGEKQQAENNTQTQQNTTTQQQGENDKKEDKKEGEDKAKGSSDSAFNVEITDDLIEYCLIHFDIKSQTKMEKIIYKLKLLNIEKAQDIALKYAKNSLKYEISNNLKELIYKILVGIASILLFQKIITIGLYLEVNKEVPFSDYVKVVLYIGLIIFFIVHLHI